MRAAPAVSPHSGVDALTGAGLAQALIGADVDVTNPPALDGPTVREFFETSGRNRLYAGRAAGVRHHVVLSIVGIEGLLASDYFRAKKVQEVRRLAARQPATAVVAHRHSLTLKRRSSIMREYLKAALLAATLAWSGSAAAEDGRARPTIVLVHGAFADSSSWGGVITRLTRDGYRVVAAANPLRGVARDAASVAAVLGAIDGPVVLVGHSYGGPVITEAASGNPHVKALVYVAGFAPDTGETSLSLSAKFPGSTLGAALMPIRLPDGGQNLYIEPAKFHAQFAADVPAAQAAVMAVAQRPVTLAALSEPSRAASWKVLPSYMIYGTADRNIPPAVMNFMAERANARKAVVVNGGSHALMVSHPGEVAVLIEDAAEAK